MNKQLCVVNKCSCKNNQASLIKVTQFHYQFPKVGEYFNYKSRGYEDLSTNTQTTIKIEHKLNG